MNNNQVDTSVIAVLPFSTVGFFKHGKPTDLTTADLLKIEDILSKCIYDYNLEKEGELAEAESPSADINLRKSDYTIDLSQYKRQYVAMMNPKGEKVIWLNCFCNCWQIDWKTDLVFVKDGGKCYFNLKVNLTTGAYYELSVNGEA